MMTVKKQFKNKILNPIISEINKLSVKSAIKIKMLN